MMRINKMKQEQSKQDMILSVNEKNALLKRQRELEEYEDELVKRFYGEQQQRSDELRAMKAEAEAQKDAIFQKLSAEEAARRAEYEYVENMRNDL
jgi:predicted RNA-binding Zn ribbon-like protein